MKAQNLVSLMSSLNSPVNYIGLSFTEDLHGRRSWIGSLILSANSLNRAFQQACRSIVEPWWHLVSLRKENRLRREGLLDARKFFRAPEPCRRIACEEATHGLL